MDNQAVNQIRIEITKCVHSLVGTVAEAQLQRHLNANMPEWITAAENAPVDAAVLLTQFAQQHVPENSFRIMKLMGNQAIRNQNIALTCEMKSQYLHLNTTSPPGSSMRASFVGPKKDQAAELFLIVFPNCNDRVAVIPTKYLIERGLKQPDFKVSEGEVPTRTVHLSESLCIAAELHPFIVSRPLLPDFLRKIRDAAEAQDNRPIVNPTTNVIYHDFYPRLRTIQPLIGLASPNHVIALTRLQWFHDAFEAHGSKFKVRQNYYQPWLGDFLLEKQDMPIPAAALKPYVPASVHTSLPGQQPHAFVVEHKANFWDYSPDGRGLIFHSTAQEINHPLFQEGVPWDFFIADNSTNSDILVLPRDFVPQNWWNVRITGPNVILAMSQSVRRFIHSSSDIRSFVRWLELLVLEHKYPDLRVPVNLDAMTVDDAEDEQEEDDGSLSQKWRSFPPNTPVEALMIRHVYFFAINIFEITVRQLCRRNKYGILYRLGQSHPWGDFMFLPYKWNDNDCADYDKNNKRVPKDRDAVPAGCNVLLITVCALNHHKSEAKIAHCGDKDLRQIKKAQTGKSILFSLAPLNGQLTKKCWFVIPPSKLRAASLLEKVEKSSNVATKKGRNTKSYGSVEIGSNDQDRMLSHYMMAPGLFVPMLRNLYHHGHVNLQTGYDDTRVALAEVMKKKFQVDQAGLQAFRRKQADGDEDDDDFHMGADIDE